jgi:hypothetical protein
VKANRKQRVLDVQRRIARFDGEGGSGSEDLEVIELA